MDCRPPGSSVHGILQARILEWVTMLFSSRSSPARDQTRSPTLQANSLPAEPQGMPKNTGVGRLSLLQQAFWPRNQTGVSCIAGGFFSNWAIREAWGRNGEYLRARSSGVMGITSAVLNGTLSSLCVGELMPFEISPPLFLFLNGAENFLCSRLQFFIMINYSSRTA